MAERWRAGALVRAGSRDVIYACSGNKGWWGRVDALEMGRAGLLVHGSGGSSSTAVQPIRWGYGIV